MLQFFLLCALAACSPTGPELTAGGQLVRVNDHFEVHDSEGGRTELVGEFPSELADLVQRIDREPGLIALVKVKGTGTAIKAADATAAMQVTELLSVDVQWSPRMFVGTYMGRSTEAEGPTTGKIGLNEDGSFQMVLLDGPQGRRDILGSWSLEGQQLTLMSREFALTAVVVRPGLLQITAPEAGVNIFLERMPN